VYGQNEDELTSSSKDVSSRELPHSSEQLSKTTAEDGHADNRIGMRDASCLQVVQRQNECCRCEGEKTTMFELSAITQDDR